MVNVVLVQQPLSCGDDHKLKKKKTNQKEAKDYRVETEINMIQLSG